jgi:hypothetical protein
VLRCRLLAALLLALAAAGAPGPAAAGTLEPDVPPPASTLAAIDRLPLGSLPAPVSRPADAERGTLVMALPAFGGVAGRGELRSSGPGVVGRMERHGRLLVLRFRQLRYQVGPLLLSAGLAIGRQTLALDPSRANRLRIDLRTGEVTRRFDWILTATDATYDGSRSLRLEDRGRSGVVRVERLPGGRYRLTLRTVWTAKRSLQFWSIGALSLPAGVADVRVEVESRYDLDLSP